MIKTAKINVYPLFQAQGFDVVALYRNKVVANAAGLDRREPLETVLSIAKRLGFTHASVTEESAWLEVTRYRIKL